MAAQARIRVAVVDDHPVVRTGLAELIDLSEDMVLAGAFADGESFLAGQEAAGADVVILDMFLPGLNGVQVARRLRQRNDHTQILVLTGHAGDDFLFAALEAGVRGFLQKDSPEKDILRAIRQIRHGETTLGPDATGLLVRRLEGDHHQGLQPDPLTAREYEITCLVAGGLSNAEIADSLCISLTTVRTHVSHILAKLHLKRRSQAVAYAFRHGMVGADAEQDLHLAGSPASR